MLLGRALRGNNGGKWLIVAGIHAPVPDIGPYEGERNESASRSFDMANVVPPSEGRGGL